MKLYSPEEMAEMMGISIHTIYSKTSTRNRGHTNVDLPPFIKLGKLIRFPEEDYRAWLGQQERQVVS